jgi:hypothetical protein
MKYITLIVAALLAGCASSPSDPDALAKNWNNCVELYKQELVMFKHYQHDPGEERAIDMRSDLAFNECKKYLKDAWVY